MKRNSIKRNKEIYALCNSFKVVPLTHILEKLKELVALGADLNWQDPTDGHNTAFIHRAFAFSSHGLERKESEEILKFFLENGANVNYFSNMGYSALWVLSNRELFMEDFQTLQHYKANPYLQNEKKENLFDYTDSSENYLNFLKHFPPMTQEELNKCLLSCQKFNKENKNNVLNKKIVNEANFLEISEILDTVQTKFTLTLELSTSLSSLSQKTIIKI